jgi:hypothetical protein|nr:Ser-Thr-rich GPI-anchored membrane family protein [Candidatus Krumholzibacteria bacterium]
MKKLMVLPLLLLIGGLFLMQAGCGGDDDPATPPQDEDCSLSLTHPVGGSDYLSGDRVVIRWGETGNADEVELELLKAGNLVGSIGVVANDGYQSWDADTMGALSGTDFSIRITAVGESGCTDTGAEFTIINTAGCELSIDFPDSNWLNAGDTFEIVWSSQNTIGSVNIELLRMDLPDDEPVGFIATDTPDDGSFLWTVDSLNQGTYEFFYLRITDSNNSSCFAETGSFGMVDDDICEIWVNDPQPGVTWDEGDHHDIVFTAPYEDTEHVNINLYKGLQFVDFIAVQLPVTGVEQVYDWLVSTGGDTSAGSTYRLKFIDADDPYCVTWSPNFTINRDLAAKH